MNEPHRTQMGSFLKSLYIFLVIFVLIFSVIALSDTASARTPPVHGLPKPNDFLIQLPFEPGTSSHLRYYSYGSPGSQHFGLDHYAIDFSLNGGDVYPIASGTVVYNRWIAGYGNAVFIRHDPNFPNYVSLYAHLSSTYVTEGQNVNTSTVIGSEGSTGTSTQHLHFALRYCNNVQVGQLPKDNCTNPVVPEPFLGADVYEGLGWWHTHVKNGSASDVVTAASRPIGDTSPPLPQNNYWNTGSTSNNAQININNPIVFDIHYEDIETDIGEIRLTIYYQNWATPNSLSDFDPAMVWRILARCNPDKARPLSGCGPNRWQFTWNPYESDDGKPSTFAGLLPVPWLPKANMPPTANTPVEACISFDVFDKAGNPIYSPGGTQCNFGSHSYNLSQITSPLDNQPRYIQIMPMSAGLPNPDQAVFLADVTIPDGTVVNPGQSLVKTWRLRNTGSSSWGNGYQLVFISGNQMGGPNAVNVPATAPGNTADISVNLVAPSNSGSYTGHWRLRNPQGTYFGPAIWVRITVPGGSTPPPANAIELSCTNCPSTVPPGHTFRPTIRAQVNSGQLLGSRGDMLRNTDGNLFGAWPHVAVTGVVKTGQSYDFTFYADNPIQAPSTPGTYQTKWRAWQDGQWSGPEFTIQFQVQEGGGVNRPPNPPTPTNPGNWAVFQGTNNIVLQAQHNGDPDGDPITHYYFEILESHDTPSSGWITTNSWSPPGLGFYGYQWRVKVRDSRGAESGWSEIRHFTVNNPAVTITQFYIETNPMPEWLSGQEGQDKYVICGSATNTTALEFKVNLATDGSDSGEWINAGTSTGNNCNSPSDRPPTWGQLEYESGCHLFRMFARGEGGWENAATMDTTICLANERRPGPPFTRYPQHNSFIDSRTVRFEWIQPWRTTEYHLEVSANDDFSNLLVNEVLPYNVTAYTYTLPVDYEIVYWRVTATGPYGTNEGGSNFRVDITPPTSQIVSLPQVTTENSFVVNWSGSDARSGLRWYHLQVREGDRPDSEWTDWLVNTTKTAEIFRGSPGQVYYFRARAMDNVGNWEAWSPGNGDTFTLIDPTAAPPTAWWNDSYESKRNIVILNNDSDSMPTGFPVRVRYDGTTTPTAAEIYSASLAANKGDDVRIIHDNQTELHRFVTYFSPTRIEIWFPIQTPIGGGQTSSGVYQIYYGNPAPGSPPATVNTVFLPSTDSNTTGLWHFYEGSGSVANDTSGNNRNGTFYNAGWTDGYLGRAGYFNGSNAYVEIAHTDAFRPGAITMEAWVYLTGSAGEYPMIFNKDRYWLRVHGDRNVQMLIKADGGDRSITSQTRLELNQWYHVAATFDGSQRMRIYINGQLDREANNGAPPTSWNTHPLRIGRSDYTGGSYFPGYIQHARISNIERTDFSYGRVNIGPAVETGALIEPPVVGAADLAILQLRTYPATSGGVLIEAIVENQGSISTRNGFSTDLHVDHLPVGIGDYTGSIQFWINDPIQAGERITLTTVLETLPEQVAIQASNVGQITEFSGILYAQVDSTGVVSEPDTQNNIYAEGTDFCLATSDSYEGNDSWQDAGQLILNTAQTHNFYRPGDEDWFVIQAEAEVTYYIKTLNLEASADTYLYLYSSDGETFLDGNDDYNNSLASFIEWTAPASGQYYLRVKHWNPNVAGCGTNYTVSFRDTLLDFLYLPIIVK